MHRHRMGAARVLACMVGMVYATSAFAGTTPSPPHSSNTPITPAVPATGIVVDWNAFHFGRAVDCWTKGDFRAAAASLENIDVTPASTFAQADRAAFLLAGAYLRLNDVDAFERVAARAGSDTGSPYRRWIRYLALIESTTHAPTAGAVPPAAPDGFAGGAILEAALLLESGNAKAALAVLDASKPADALSSVHLYVHALALRAAGADPSRDLEALCAQKPRHALESDLVGRAAIELAALRIGQPERASRALGAVPKESAHHPRALQLQAMIAIEAGDTATAAATLRTLAHDHPATAEARDIQLARGSMMMKRGDWRSALRYFDAAADQWDGESRAMERLMRGEGAAEAWKEWQDRADWDGEIRLAPEAVVDMVIAMSDASLGTSPTSPSPATDQVAAALWPADPARTSASWDSTGALERHAPDAQEWERVRSIERASSDARAALAHEERNRELRWLELEQRARYLERGGAMATESGDTLAATIERLNMLIARLDAALADLAGVRDGALAHVAARTREMVSQLRDEVVFMRALRHFHVDGPQRSRPEVFPPGTPAPADVLAREEALALQADQFLEFFAAHYSRVIQLSFERVWRPHLAENSRRLRGQLQTEMARARATDASIDSALARLSTDAELAAIGRRCDKLTASIDSLDVAAVQARTEIAKAVAMRAREDLAIEREAIDYHLADATYELAVQAGTDSTAAETVVAAAPTRDLAIERVSAFVARYPASPARSESRYRLADLHLLRARDEFRSRMAGFLGDTPSSDDIQNRSLAPFVDYAPAIEQYEAILHEDPAFAHTDAVLFNLGMILADDGDPVAMTYLTRLVTEFPAAPDVQEAWLRMGNDRFDRRDFAGAAPLFDHAVQGPDPSFTAMALYKLGWSRFEEEQFEEAAGAFAHLIDHYDHHAEIARKIDLRQEAEECLVHALARAGGAPAFARYFDRIGRRPYEARVLTSLAFLFRGSSLYAEAVECETMWLARYPDDPAAFTVAERLVDTYQRWNKPELARQAKREQAERFLPGAAWQRAQKDEAVRAAADDFARTAYREAAAYAHARARKSNDPVEWRDALAQYEACFKHWPRADDTPRLHLLASDAASHVHDYALALKHLDATMASDSLALVHDAAWQRVVVADAWYRRAQPAGAKTASDSLATLVLKIGDEFTARFSRDPHCPDIAWRQGNVALAHGRYDEAAERLERFGTAYPADKRALPAVVRSADARYRLQKFEAAGATYEKALVLARAAKRDSLATSLETTIPTCYYQDAERIARADSTRGERDAAPKFASVARAWPRFKHADLALYRAGLGFSAGKQHAEAVAAWEELLRVYPKSEYARDSAAQLAVTLEASGDRTRAADAYERFAQAYPKDEDAPGALLKAADLRAASGDVAGAESTRSRFLAAFPGEVAAGMDIRGARAQKELASIAANGGSVSSLLGKKSNSDVKAYLALAAAHPELASPLLLAQCDFLNAEEAHTSYASIKLTQPLPKSIEKKKTSLESMIALYERCTRRGVAEYTHASANRIGMALIEFGDALAASERPAGLGQDDLAAYDEVLTEQSYAFYDRGEDAWSTLLRQSARDPDDPGRWLARTREALWPRLGARFLFHPEVDYPLVRATPPAPAPAP